MTHPARKAPLAAWLVAALPWLWLAARDFSLELASPGHTSDAPHQFATLAFVEMLVPVTVASLLLALVLGIHVWLKEAGMRRRIAVWFGLLAAGVGLLSVARPATFPSRAVFNAVEAKWLASLAVLPVLWSIRKRGV